MGIFVRVSDIITANLSDLVERFENPQTMLKQAVREMEETIEETKKQTARVLADVKMVGRELDKNRQAIRVWADRAEQAVADENDALARKAIVRKHEHGKIAVGLEDQLAASRQSSQALRCQLEAMQAKLAEAKRRLASLTARQHAVELDTALRQDPDDASVATAAFAKFDRMREKVELAEAEAEAMQELDRGAFAPESPVEHEPAPADSEVELELAQLKKKIR